MSEREIARTGPLPGKSALHGRRKGRPLSQAQAKLLAEKLPALRLDLSVPAPAPLAKLFPGGARRIWLEIGFGGGEHLLFQAAAHPETGIIGCEPFVTGVARVLQGMEAARLTNIRLHDGDANHVLDWLPDRSIDRVFILFPDPWPKRRHRKRRFLTAAGLDRLARVMRTGAQLRFASDIADYAVLVCEGVEASPDFAARPGQLAARPDDWPVTRYAEKAEAAGRRCGYFVFERI